MFGRRVAMAKRRDVQVGRHLLHGDTAVDATGWAIVDSVVRGPEGCVSLF